MTFTETQHPREADGKFAEKVGGLPEVALEGFLQTPPDRDPDIVNGQYVVYAYEDRDGNPQERAGRVLHTGFYPDEEEEKIFTLLMDDGDTWSGMRASEVRIDTSRDSSASIEEAARFDAAYAITRDLPQDSMPQSDRIHMLDIDRGINEGAWEDWRIESGKAFDNFREEALRVSEDGDLLRERLDDQHEGHYRHLSRLGITDDEKRELGITQQTALAVYYRDRIGTSDLWTQEHYDHVTRPYREATGKKAHPDDSDERPASWDYRQHTSLSPAAKYDGPAWDQKSLSAHADSLWAEARADATDPLKIRAATIATAALDKLYGQN